MLKKITLIITFFTASLLVAMPVFADNAGNWTNNRNWNWNSANNQNRSSQTNSNRRTGKRNNNASQAIPSYQNNSWLRVNNNQSTPAYQNNNSRWQGNQNQNNYFNNQNSNFVGTVTNINGNTISINANNGNNYFVNISNASITDASNVNIGLSGVSINDTISINGSISGNIITATSIVDQSSFNSNFVGRVTDISGNTITLNANNGTIYFVNIDNTAFTNSNNATVGLSDVSINDTISVNGHASGIFITATSVMDETNANQRGNICNQFNNFCNQPNQGRQYSKPTAFVETAVVHRRPEQNNNNPVPSIRRAETPRFIPRVPELPRIQPAPHYNAPVINFNHPVQASNSNEPVKRQEFHKNLRNFSRFFDRMGNR